MTTSIETIVNRARLDFLAGATYGLILKKQEWHLVGVDDIPDSLINYKEHLKETGFHPETLIFRKMTGRNVGITTNFLQTHSGMMSPQFEHGEFHLQIL